MLKFTAEDTVANLAEKVQALPAESELEKRVKEVALFQLASVAQPNAYLHLAVNVVIPLNAQQVEVQITGKN